MSDARVSLSLCLTLSVCFIERLVGLPSSSVRARDCVAHIWWMWKAQQVRHRVQGKHCSGQEHFHTAPVYYTCPRHFLWWHINSLLRPHSLSQVIALTLETVQQSGHATWLKSSASVHLSCRAAHLWCTQWTFHVKVMSDHYFIFKSMRIFF